MNSFELSGKYCIHNKVIVLDETDSGIHIGMCEEDLPLQKKIERIFFQKKYSEKKMIFSIITTDEWKRNFSKIFSRHLLSIPSNIKVLDEKKNIDEAPIINLLNSLLIECHFNKGSDIHIEYCIAKICIRFRIQGYMYNQMDVSFDTGNALIQRIKMMSKLEITERRRCQDGRFNFCQLNYNIDVRVSCIPSFFGESVVMRLLDRKSVILPLENLGFKKVQLEKLQKIEKQKNGLVLICGATGSGKTTTLCSLLNQMSKNEKKILSIEDPVEYIVDGVVQIPVNEERELSFNEVLKRIFRQDPDVIVIGEIRDSLTAQTAVRSAMTGHLVFATLHTSTASESVYRLLDLGVQGFLLAPVLRWIIVQELLHVSLKERRLNARIIECSEKISSVVAHAENFELLRFTLENEGTL